MTEQPENLLQKFVKQRAAERWSLKSTLELLGIKYFHYKKRIEWKDERLESGLVRKIEELQKGENLQVCKYRLILCGLLELPNGSAKYKTDCNNEVVVSNALLMNKCPRCGKIVEIIA